MQRDLLRLRYILTFSEEVERGVDRPHINAVGRRIGLQVRKVEVCGERIFQRHG